VPVYVYVHFSPLCAPVPPRTHLPLPVTGIMPPASGAPRVNSSSYFPTPLAV
jgi:hypothetical protein